MLNLTSFSELDSKFKFLKKCTKQKIDDYVDAQKSILKNKKIIESVVSSEELNSSS